MQVKIDIECTPEEARRLMGLPDLSSLHEIYLGQMREMMTHGVSADMMEQMIKSWMPMTELGGKMFQSMFNSSGDAKA